MQLNTRKMAGGSHATSNQETTGQKLSNTNQETKIRIVHTQVKERERVDYMGIISSACGSGETLLAVLVSLNCTWQNQTRKTPQKNL